MQNKNMYPSFTKRLVIYEIMHLHYFLLGKFTYNFELSHDLPPSLIKMKCQVLHRLSDLPFSFFPTHELFLKLSFTVLSRLALDSQSSCCSYLSVKLQAYAVVPRKCLSFLISLSSFLQLHLIFILLS